MAGAALDAALRSKSLAGPHRLRDSQRFEFRNRFGRALALDTVVAGVPTPLGGYRSMRIAAVVAAIITVALAGVAGATK